MSNAKDLLSSLGATDAAEKAKVELIEEALTKHVAGGRHYENVDTCGSDIEPGCWQNDCFNVQCVD